LNVNMWGINGHWYIKHQIAHKKSPPHQRTKNPLYMVDFTFIASKSGALRSTQKEPAGIRISHPLWVPWT